MHFRSFGGESGPVIYNCEATPPLRINIYGGRGGSLLLWIQHLLFKKREKRTLLCLHCRGTGPYIVGLKVLFFMSRVCVHTFASWTSFCALWAGQCGKRGTACIGGEHLTYSLAFHLASVLKLLLLLYYWHQFQQSIYSTVSGKYGQFNNCKSLKPPKLGYHSKFQKSLIQQRGIAWRFSHLTDIAHFDAAGSGNPGGEKHLGRRTIDSYHKP